MKEKIMQMLLDCDKKNHGILGHPKFSSSSSIEEIATYINSRLIPLIKEQK